MVLLIYNNDYYQVIIMEENLEPNIEINNKTSSTSNKSNAEEIKENCWKSLRGPQDFCIENI